MKSHVDKRITALGIDVDRYAERFDARQLMLAKASVVAVGCRWPDGRGHRC